MYYLYILKSERTSRYYVGSTDDLVRRLQEHNAGKTPSTRNKGPWRILYSETFQTHSEARSREAKIKSWKSRAYMERVLGLGVSSGG